MENARAMVLLSFAADALCLPAHWIYNTEEIASRFGGISDYLPPAPGSYHEGKAAGDFTHYGDQTLWLLSCLAGEGGFSKEGFFSFWRKKMEGYQGYKDNASKDTLAKLAEGMPPEEVASQSSDLAGASRIAPLVYFFQDSPEACAEACREQTALTHGNAQVIEASGFFAAAALFCLSGLYPGEALPRAAREVGLSAGLCEKLSRGTKSRDQETLTAIKGFGQMCDVSAAFASVIHLVLRYEEDPAAALTQNIKAGGDSAARGMLAGMLLGACHGFSGWPEKWISEMIAADEIKASLDKLDAARPRA